MITFNRRTSAQTEAVGTRKSTRARLHNVAAGAAFAFIVGLSAPAAALAASTSTPASHASGTEKLAAATVAAVTGQRPATTSATAQAGTKPTTDSKTPSGSASTADSTANAGATAATQQAKAATPAPAPPKVSAPSNAQLYPVGVKAEQARFTPSAEQLKNAKAIVDAGKKMGLPPRAWVIAVATSLQESNLKNIGNLGAANDHDSLGLFQQRPSSGWGTPAQVQNPTYAATAFYKGLVGVKGWDKMPLTQAAQAVQVSAYPDHYAKHESEAGDIIRSLYGAGPYAAVAKQLK